MAVELVAAETGCTVRVFKFNNSSASEGHLFTIYVSPPSIDCCRNVTFSILKVSNLPIMSEREIMYFRLNLVFGTNSANAAAVMPYPANRCAISGLWGPIGAIFPVRFSENLVCSGLPTLKLGTGSVSGLASAITISPAVHLPHLRDIPQSPVRQIRVDLEPLKEFPSPSYRYMLRFRRYIQIAVAAQ